MVVHDIKNIFAAGAFDTRSEPDDEHLTFRDIWSFIKRNFFVFAICAALGIAAGVTYLLYTPPQYVAVTRLVMDPAQAKIATQDTGSGTIIIESAEIASQVEIVKSESVAKSVIEELNLLEDPEIQTAQSWRSKVRSQISALAAMVGIGDADEGPQPLTEGQLMRKTMAGFLGRVTARRVGQSYVLEVGYKSTDPDHAAVTANAIARTYIQNGMEERSNAAKRGATWLEERLIEIGRQARESQMMVENFRHDNGITPVGATSSLDEQQLIETSSQVLSAQSQTAAEVAKLETIRRLIAGDVPNGVIDDSINNAQIQKLRDESRIVENKLELLKQRYDGSNAAIVAAQAELARLQADLQNELLRLEGVYLSNVEVARAKERIIEAGLSQLKDQGIKNNLARVDLVELESRAATYRRMYENVLQQLIGALQVQSFPLGTARIVTAATSPLSKSTPKTSIILPLFTLLGLSGGLLIAAWREGMDRSLGTGTRLKRELGIETLGKIPVRATRMPLPAFMNSAIPPRSVQTCRSIVEAPYSDFSESIRDIKSAINAANQMNDTVVVGIMSPNAGDGKTSLAVNLAQMYVNEGVKAVAVDADFTNATLSNLLAKHADDCALTLADEYKPAEPKPKGRGRKKTPETPPETEPASSEEIRLPVAPVWAMQEKSDAKGRYAHLPALNEGLQTLRENYQMVVVDMSGFSKSADAREVCAMMDGVVLVVGNSRTTTIESLATSLSQFGKTKLTLYGVVFNRTGKERKASKRSAVRGPRAWNEVTS